MIHSIVINMNYVAVQVWGLTAGILIQIAQKAFGRPRGFLELSPGSRPYHQLFFNGERLLWRDNSS